MSRCLAIGLLGMLAGCGDGAEAPPADRLVATWEMTEKLSGVEVVTTLKVKPDGLYDYDVVYGSQRLMSPGGWIADHVRLTLTPEACAAGAPCPPTVYQYLIDGAGQTLTLTFQPFPGAGSATLQLSRK